MAVEGTKVGQLADGRVVRRDQYSYDRPVATPPVLYKVTSANGGPAHGGKGLWPLPKNDQPGDWRDEMSDPLNSCHVGLHLSSREQLPTWLQDSKHRLFLAEIDGPVLGAGEKYVAARVRLVKEVIFPKGMARPSHSSNAAYELRIKQQRAKDAAYKAAHPKILKAVVRMKAKEKGLKSPVDLRLANDEFALALKKAYRVARATIAFIGAEERLSVALGNPASPTFPDRLKAAKDNIEFFLDPKPTWAWDNTRTPTWLTGATQVTTSSFWLDKLPLDVKKPIFDGITAAIAKATEMKPGAPGTWQEFLAAFEIAHVKAAAKAKTKAKFDPATGHTVLADLAPVKKPRGRKA